MHSDQLETNGGVELTKADLEFMRMLISGGLCADSVLELGGGYGGSTCKELIESSGKRYFATNMYPASGVDIVADFETGEGVDDVASAGPFGTVLVLNVLEHTFNPIAVLDNVVRVTERGGTIVAIAPAVWPIHNFPIDCCRLLPDWYRHYAAKRGLMLKNELFCYLEGGAVDAFRSPDGQDNFPPPAFNRPNLRLWSRAVHRLLNTFGRGMAHQSHLAIGVAMQRPL